MDWFFYNLFGAIDKLCEKLDTPNYEKEKETNEL